jgi:SAM-dependent methyltransferase
MTVTARFLASHTIFRRRLRRMRELDTEYDRLHGVDTGGIVEIDTEGDQGQVEFCNRYQAIHPTLFKDVISRIEEDLEDFVFVDFGSGKGRALLLATDYPFKRIVGVEFAAGLCALAAKNVERFRSTTHRAEAIDIVCNDARAYELPDDKLVLYFYNPFEENIAQVVFSRISKSLEAHPRRIYLVLLDVSYPVQLPEFVEVASSRPNQFKFRILKNTS